MPTLNIEGVGRVKVSDDFLKLSPYEQQSTADDIAKQAQATRAKGVAKEMQQPDYGKMSGGEVAMEAVKNIPSSAGKMAADIAQPFIHPVETATNIGKIGKGVLQKLGIMEGEDAAPYADAVGKFLVDRYGSGEAIKKTLATDPVGMAADLSMVLSGGGTVAARAPGAIGKLGEVAATAGRVVDPLSAVGKTVQGAGKLAAKGLGVTTGAGSDAIEIAARAGAAGGAEGKAFRDSMSGAEPADAIVADARKAVGQLRQERGQIYRTEMAKVGANKTVLDFADIDTAVTNSVKKFKGVSVSPSVEKIQEVARVAVEDWKGLNPAEYHTAEGFDALKQKIGDIRDATQYGTPERLAADKVYQAVRATIAKQVPEYAKIMKGYETASTEIKEIERTLSLNPKASVDTALRKILSALRDNVNTNYGKRKELVGLLARSGATHLLQKIAGKSLSSAAPRGLSRVLAGGEGMGALSALALGHPGVAAAAIPGLAASSPALVGGAAHGAGAVSRLPLRRLGQGSRLIGAAGQ